MVRSFRGQHSWERCAVCCIPAPFAPHPPAPFSPCGRRGSLSVLMPETEDGTQGLPQKLTPAREHPFRRTPDQQCGGVARNSGGLVVFEEIIRSRPRRRALPWIAEGLWSLKK
jgi:hypothetical protein